MCDGIVLAIVMSKQDSLVEPVSYINYLRNILLLI